MSATPSTTVGVKVEGVDQLESSLKRAYEGYASLRAVSERHERLFAAPGGVPIGPARGLGVGREVYGDLAKDMASYGKSVADSTRRIDDYEQRTIRLAQRLRRDVGSVADAQGRLAFVASQDVRERAVDALSGYARGAGLSLEQATVYGATFAKSGVLGAQAGTTRTAFSEEQFGRLIFGVEEALSKGSQGGYNLMREVLISGAASLAQNASVSSASPVSPLEYAQLIGAANSTNNPALRGDAGVGLISQIDAQYANATGQQQGLFYQSAQMANPGLSPYEFADTRTQGLNPERMQQLFAFADIDFKGDARERDYWLAKNLNVTQGQVKALRQMNAALPAFRSSTDPRTQAVRDRFARPGAAQQYVSVAAGLTTGGMSLDAAITSYETLSGKKYNGARTQEAFIEALASDTAPMRGAMGDKLDQDEATIANNYVEASRNLRGAVEGIAKLNLGGSYGILGSSSGGGFSTAGGVGMAVAGAGTSFVGSLLAGVAGSAFVVPAAQKALEAYGEWRNPGGGAPPAGGAPPTAPTGGGGWGGGGGTMLPPVAGATPEERAIRRAATEAEELRATGRAAGGTAASRRAAARFTAQQEAAAARARAEAAGAGGLRSRIARGLFGAGKRGGRAGTLFAVAGGALDASLLADAAMNPATDVPMPEGLTSEEQLRWRMMNEQERLGPVYGGESALVSPFGTTFEHNPAFDEARDRNPFGSWGNFWDTLNPFSDLNNPGKTRDRTYDEAVAEDARRAALGNSVPDKAPLVPTDPLRRRWLEQAGAIPGAAGVGTQGTAPTKVDPTLDSDIGLGGGFSDAAYARDQRRTTEATVENTRLLNELANSLDGKTVAGGPRATGGPVRAVGGPLPVTGTTSAKVAGTPTSSTPYGPSGDGSGVGDTSQWRGLIEKHARAGGVDPDIIQGIMMLESGGNPNARNTTNGIGRDAMGLMQVLQDEWPKGTPDSVMLDPDENIRKGVEVLNGKHNMVVKVRPDRTEAENWDASLAAYFGAIDWDDATVTTAADPGGTTGVEYVAIIKANIEALKKKKAAGTGGPVRPSALREAAPTPDKATGGGIVDLLARLKQAAGQRASKPGDWTRARPGGDFLPPMVLYGGGGSGGGGGGIGSVSAPLGAGGSGSGPAASAPAGGGGGGGGGVAASGGDLGVLRDTLVPLPPRDATSGGGDGRAARPRRRYGPLTVEVIRPDGRVERHLLQLTVERDGTTITAERDDAPTASEAA